MILPFPYSEIRYYIVTTSGPHLGYIDWPPRGSHCDRQAQIGRQRYKPAVQPELLNITQQGHGLSARFVCMLKPLMKWHYFAMWHLVLVLLSRQDEWLEINQTGSKIFKFIFFTIRIPMGCVFVKLSSSMYESN